MKKRADRRIGSLRGFGHEGITWEINLGTVV